MEFGLKAGFTSQTLRSFGNQNNYDCIVKILALFRFKEVRSSWLTLNEIMIVLLAKGTQGQPFKSALTFSSWFITWCTMCFADSEGHPTNTISGRPLTMFQIEARIQTKEKACSIIPDNDPQCPTRPGHNLLSR